MVSALRPLRTASLHPLSLAAVTPFAPFAPLATASRTPRVHRMVHTEAKIEELGLSLPAMPQPLASYTPIVQTGSLVYLSGHVPFTADMKQLHVGKVGKEYTTEEAAAFAEFIGLELVSTLKAHVGDLDKVTRIVKLVGFVNCVDTYTEQPEVINGCSNIIGKIFGAERGTHARSAVGTNSLPRNVPVEIEMIAEING
uniref:Endoribonuclease L-PSP/chorismate mutase-like domain-containing protein n=1 Tax=Calcidiscus leptoporus TaxID=127549 RepID=A0A7S0IRS7_9EUKA|mmetsp:Transcript_18916/g.43472  ORF Transcript_18916/g.43472 Transcript_18916/m.43472 type:complete len:198 (+) Transcript_18916:18-611(+)